MTKRRSLGDALTPEQETFLAAGNAATPNVAPDELGGIDAIPAKPQIEIKPPQTISNGWLVPITTRIKAPMMEALARASMERKLQRLEPYTQQDIVSEALADWLKAKGHKFDFS